MLRGKPRQLDGAGLGIFVVVYINVDASQENTGSVQP